MIKTKHSIVSIIYIIQPITSLKFIRVYSVYVYYLNVTEFNSVNFTQLIINTSDLAVRWICGVSLENRISSKDMNGRMGVVYVQKR